MRDNFSDACRKTKLDDLPADWMAYELAVLFTKWAQLYTDPLYAAMDFDAFKKLNIETLYFDNAANATPAQRVNPPTKAAAIPAPSAGYNKRGRGAQPAAEWVSEFNPAISFSPNARLIDEVRNQGLGPKLVGKQTITFLLCRLPSYFSGSGLEERGNARAAMSDPVRVCFY